MAHDVFISFSFEDQTKAEYVVNTLTTVYGISCWICTRDIAKGSKYKEKITEAIVNSQVVVLIQSKSAVESTQIPNEIGIALEEDIKVIPFRIDEAKLKNALRYDLHGVEYIDGTIPPEELRIHDLARSISAAIGKPLLTDPVQNRHVLPVKSTRLICSEIFRGRDGLLRQIHQSFEDRNIVFLHGMGGIGKSELARQYWKANKNSYETVIFARYDGSVASLIADDKVFNISGMARKMTQGDTPQSDEDYARDKLSILKNYADTHTLIILDNFDVSIKEDPFFEEMACDADYRLLVTTRCEPDVKKYRVISVGEIEDEDLKDLFVSYANPKKTMIEMDDPDFDELFKLTNRHTYTLELIAKSMEENDEIDYLSEMIDYLKDHGFNGIHVNGYDTICKLFRLTALNEEEKYFLRCLAIMPPAGIDQKMFKHWIGHAFCVRSRLVDLSLVKINGATRSISLHPVIREVVINELTPSYQSCKEFIDRCVMRDCDTIPHMWGLPYREKSIRMECYISLVNFLGEITADTYPVFVCMSYMYNFIGTYSQAMALHQNIYNFAKKHFGEESMESMLVYNRMGWKCSNSYLFEQALPYYQKAADYFVSNPCYSIRESHDVLRTCADVHRRRYVQTGDTAYLQKAYNYLAHANRYGKDMLEASGNASEEFKLNLRYQIDCTVVQYYNLYMAEQKYDMAEIMLKQFKVIVDEFARAIGAPNVDLATYYRHSAKLKMKQGHYMEARKLIEECYRLYLDYFSLRNARLIEILEEVIQCCMLLKDYETAGKYLATALESAKLIFTEDHPRLIRLLEMQKQMSEKRHIDEMTLYC